MDIADSNRLSGNDGMPHVYIVTNQPRTLHVDVTNDLHLRMYKHKNGMAPGFAQRHGLDRLVYFEEFPEMDEATDREKQLKVKTRAFKVELVESMNPEWKK